MKTRVSSKSSKLLSLASTLIVAGVLALCSTETRANTVALDFTNSGTAGNSDVTVGWAFSLSSAALVTDLGVWDQNSDGLASSHLVTIWMSTGTFVTSATVTSGTFVASSVDGFRYVSIAPTLLAAGNYVIGAYYGNPTLDKFAYNAATVTTVSGVTYIGSRSGSANAFPSGNIFLETNSYFGPNFQFATLANGVPDYGGSFVLLGIAFAALGGFHLLLRQRRSA